MPPPRPIAKTFSAFVLVLLSAEVSLAHAFPLFHHRKPAEPPTVPLSTVAAEVVHTLDTFNAEAASRNLPPLSKVTLDFNTATARSAGLSLGIPILNLGASRERDTTDEVTFTYTVPPPPAASGFGAHAVHPPPADLSATLLATLEAAVAEVKATEAIGKAQLADVTVTLAYGVVRSASGGVSGTVSLVTLGGTVSRHRSDVQTLTLNFAR